MTIFPTISSFSITSSGSNSSRHSSSSTAMISDTEDSFWNDSLSWADSDFEYDKDISECLLFPTYGFLRRKNFNDPYSPIVWVVRAKGRVINLPKSDPAKSVKCRLIKIWLGKRVAPGLEALDIFRNRFKYFLAKGVVGQELLVYLEKEYTRPVERIPSMLSLYSECPDPVRDRPSHPTCFELDYHNDQLSDFKKQLITARDPISGFFEGELEIPLENVESGNIYIRNALRFSGPTTVSLIGVQGVSVISDIDDTIKVTGVTDGKPEIIANTFFREAKAVDGMIDTYECWKKQGAQFHYVSNSPFQLISMLSDFIREKGFPQGSIHLREDSSLLDRFFERKGDFKRQMIQKIIDDFPHRKFILIGDSGEIDLEIYRDIALKYPDNVAIILIRSVISPKDRKKRNSDNVAFKARVEAAQRLLNINVEYSEDAGVLKHRGNAVFEQNP